jgi:hypothetical protein
MVSGVKWRNSGFVNSGAHEVYQVERCRHSERGFRTITVSSMESGAGSVEVSARPALPSTRSTSGKRVSIRSVFCSRICAWLTEIPGIVVGM